jgi:mannosyltransferase OCH1-like enzyme
MSRKFILTVALLSFYNNYTYHNIPIADFEQSMQCIDFPASPIPPILKTMYYQNNWQAKKPLDKNYLIPKIIHFIWLGSELPNKYQKFINSWRNYHPEWEIKIWDDCAVKSLNLKNKKLFDRASNFGYKSDLARYEILYRYGGIYVDIDFECLSSFNFLHDNYEFYAGLFPHQGIIANGLLASKPGHPILKDCIDNITVLPQKNGDKECDISIQLISGPHHFTKCILKYIDQNKQDNKIMILPAGYLFAFPANKNEAFWSGKISADDLLKYRCAESIAIHYWGCSWVK